MGFQFDNLLKVHARQIKLLVTLGYLDVKVDKALFISFSDMSQERQQEGCTFTRVWITIDEVTKALPHPAGTAVGSRTTFALIQPFVSVTMVGN